MALEHEQQQRDYTRDMKRYDSRLARLKSRATYATAAAVDRWGCRCCRSGGRSRVVGRLVLVGVPTAIGGAILARTSRRKARTW